MRTNWTRKKNIKEHQNRKLPLYSSKIYGKGETLVCALGGMKDLKDDKYKHMKGMFSPLMLLLLLEN